MEQYQAEAAAVADIVTKHIRPIEFTAARGNSEKALALLIPEGFRAASIKGLLDEYLTAPERRQGVARLTSLDSLIAHVNRFKDADSALFADENESNPSIVAVLDYHRAGAEGAPRFGRHRALYSFPLSEEFKAWKQMDEEVFGVGDFAEFLEAHILEIGVPYDVVPGSTADKVAQQLDIQYASANRLMSLSKGLTIRSEEHLVDIVNNQSGETQMVFTEKHTDEKGSPLSIPGGFLVSIPVFRGDPPYLIPAQLRYRKQGKVVTWFYKLYRLDVVFHHAIQLACERAQKATELPLFYGLPE